MEVLWWLNHEVVLQELPVDESRVHLWVPLWGNIWNSSVRLGTKVVVRIYRAVWYAVVT